MAGEAKFMAGEAKLMAGEAKCNVPQSSPLKEGSVFRFSVDECLDDREKLAAGM